MERIEDDEMPKFTDDIIYYSIFNIKDDETETETETEVAATAIETTIDILIKYIYKFFNL